MSTMIQSYRFIGTNAKFLETYAKDKYFIYCLSGGARTGKTQTVAPIFLEEINKSEPKDSFIIGSQSHATIRSVIIPSLESYDSNVSIRKTQDGLYVINDRIVVPYTYSDKDGGKKKRGLTTKLAWCDEAHSMPETIFNDLLTRLSLPDSKCILTSNPEGTSHWLYRTFILNAEKKGKYSVKDLGGGKFSVTFPSAMDEYRVSNGGHIDDGYVDMLINTLPSIEVRRLVYGEHIDSVGKIFDLSKLNFYEYEHKPFDTIYALIDPAFGQQNCFNSCIIYRKNVDKIELIDSGLLRSNAVDTVDEVLIEFLGRYKPNVVHIESNFQQAELAKKLARHFNVRKFYVKENKIKRITNQSVAIRERVYFPNSWKNIPNGEVSEWLNTSEGRGYIALSQLLNFSDVESENCIKGQDMTYIDFPDALASILYQNKTHTQPSEEVKKIVIGRPNEFV